MALESPMRLDIQAMKISYDYASESLYIHLSDRASVDSDELQDGVVLDYGALVGIDQQYASQRLDINNLSVSELRRWVSFRRRDPDAQQSNAQHPMQHPRRQQRRNQRRHHLGGCRRTREKVRLHHHLFTNPPPEAGEKVLCKWDAKFKDTWTRN